MSRAPNIIYFGGAFDPIHLGHMDAVKIAQESFPEARVILIPGCVLPESAEKTKSVVAPFIDRVAMAVVAFDEWPRVEISSIEEELDAPNYTYLTLEALAVENPGSKLAWMIGADQLASFPKWKNPKRILELASLIVLPRATVSAGDILELATQVASILGFSTALNGDRRRLDLDGAGSIYVLDRAPMVISSTEVRKLAGDNLKKIEGLVTPAVAEYIADLGLYQ